MSRQAVVGKIKTVNYSSKIPDKLVHIHSFICSFVHFFNSLSRFVNFSSVNISPQHFDSIKCFSARTPRKIRVKLHIQHFKDRQCLLPKKKKRRNKKREVNNVGSRTGLSRQQEVVSQKLQIRLRYGEFIPVSLSIKARLYRQALLSILRSAVYTTFWQNQRSSVSCKCPCRFMIKLRDRHC